MGLSQIELPERVQAFTCGPLPSCGSSGRRCWMWVQRSQSRFEAFASDPWVTQVVIG